VRIEFVIIKKIFKILTNTQEIQKFRRTDIIFDAWVVHDKEQGMILYIFVIYYYMLLYTIINY